MTKNLQGDLLDTLNSVSEFLDNYVDVVDGDYETGPRPNKAMCLKAEVDREYARLERTIEAEKLSRPRTEAEKVVVICKAIEECKAVGVSTRAMAHTILYALEERP